MARCERCSTRIGAGRTLCVGCEAKPPVPSETRCACGRLAVPGIALCPLCYREAPRENPRHPNEGGGDLYQGLAETDPCARFVCLCGGSVHPVVCFGGRSHYRCADCGTEGDLPPQNMEAYPELTPEELIARLSDPKRTMFGPPRAIRALRKAEGRNIYTGEKLEPKGEDDGPPF